MSFGSSVFERRSWLARVWGDGETRTQLIGTAFAINSTNLLTCAHVVNDAGAKGPGGRIFVDFPLLGGRGAWAVVLPDGWRPVPSENTPQSEGDTAVLQLEQTSLPIEPIPLRRRERYQGLRFSSYGFPVSNPESDSAHGRLDLKVGLEWVRVEPDSNALVEPGFSGAPVWDEDARGVVAMIVTRKQGDGRVAYAMPMTVLASSSTIVASALAGSSTPLGWLERVPMSIETDIILFNTFMRERTKDFIGREFVFEAIDQRMRDPEFPAGYILIRGEPGIGKTSVLAQAAQTRGYVHHFNILSDNVRSSTQFLRNACAQLIARYELPFSAVPPNATENSKTLENLLGLAVSRSADGYVVLLVDALDEAEQPVPGVNRLSLPRLLPEGAYVVASIRKGVELELDIEQRAQDILLEKDSIHNERDVKAYIRAFVERHWDAMKGRIAEWETSHEEFAEIVWRQSEGNFMYLHYVLPDIRKGRITRASLNQLEELPKGLSTYYTRHWNAMRDQDKERFNKLQRPIICVLATAREAVSASVVAQWINGSKSFDPVTILEVQEIFHEWAQFIQEEPSDPPRFRLYHNSFREFLEREEGLKPYVQAVAAAMRAKLNWEVQ